MDPFLDGMLREAYEIETRRDTHAIVAKNSLTNLLRGRGRTSRYVMSVDEHGKVTEAPANPLRNEGQATQRGRSPLLTLL